MLFIASTVTVWSYYNHKHKHTKTIFNCNSILLFNKNAHSLWRVSVELLKLIPWKRIVQSIRCMVVPKLTVWCIAARSTQQKLKTIFSVALPTESRSRVSPFIYFCVNAVRFLTLNSVRFRKHGSQNCYLSLRRSLDRYST